MELGQIMISEYLVGENDTIADALKRIDETGKRCVFVVDDVGKLVAALADGDVRRYVLSHGTSKGFVKDAANYDPLMVKQGDETKAKQLFDTYSLTALPVVDSEQRPVGLVVREETTRRKRRALEKPLPVVMMAGGIGSRLMPITAVLPKPLVPVNEKPIAEHIIDRFNDGGCQDFFLILNYKKGMVKAYFDDLERDYEVSYIEEEEFLGTGGGLKLVEGQIDDTFFFTNCDVLVDADLQSIYEEHKKTGNAITIVCSLKHYTIPYGTIEIAEGGEIKKMTEKPTISSLVNTGCYLVEPSVLSLIGENEVIGFPDVALRAQKAGMKVGVFPVSEGSWLDMGQPDELERMSMVLNEE